MPAPARELAPAPVAPRAVAWGRVAVFYGLALLGPLLAAGLTLATGATWGATPLTMALGALAMLFPAAAGLVVERRAGRRSLAARETDAWRGQVGRRLGRLFGWSLVAYAAIVAAWFGVAAVATSLPGAGRWRSQAEVDALMHQLSPALPADFSMPIAALLASSLVQAVLAGFTLNAVFALGEEYGWRGVLADELAPLGRARALALTGVLWGLWHAPLIALGHNYGPAHALLGIPLFVLVCVPLSAALAWTRDRSGSVLAPALVHGAFNAIAGIFVLLLADAHPLVGVPVGLLGALALAVAAAVLWGVLPPRTPQSARP